MATNKQHTTFLTNIVFALLGVTVAHLTDWFWVVPLFFGIGTPLINAQGTLRQKAGKIFVLVIVSITLFTGGFLTSLLLLSPFLKFLNHSLLFALALGICGILFLGFNALLLETVKFNLKSALTTALLTSFTFIAWTLTVDKLNMGHQSDERFLRHFGPMILWMAAGTIGIVTGIKKEKTTSNRVARHTTSRRQG